LAITQYPSGPNGRTSCLSRNLSSWRMRLILASDG
jgi:hypothetical protein